MLRVFNQGGSARQETDPGAECDYSLEFNSGYTDPYGDNSFTDTSGPLWGPGIRVPQTSSNSQQTSAKLAYWRDNNEKAESRKAAAELDKLYASLPEDAFDLTLKDLVNVDGRKASPVVSPAKNGDSRTIGSLFRRGNSKGVQRGAAREDGGKFKAKKKVHSSSTYSLPFRIPILSPKRGQSSPAAPKESPERQTLSVHLREEANGSSPNNSWGSSPSFSDFKMDSNSHGAVRGNTTSQDLPRDSRVPGSPTSPSSESMTLRQHLSPTRGSRSSDSFFPRPQANHCCICSEANLVFKTRCKVCNKTYCSKCTKNSMDSTSDGRRCKNTCAGYPISPKGIKKSVVGCWPLFGFSNNHASTAEKTREGKNQAQRYQDFENMQRRSVPPPRPSLLPRPSMVIARPTLLPRPSMVKESERQDMQRLRVRPKQSTRSVSPRSITPDQPENSYPTVFMGAA